MSHLVTSGIITSTGSGFNFDGFALFFYHVMMDMEKGSSHVNQMMKMFSSKFH